jgi:predicted dinucleotide-binding enzyme
MKIGILGTGNVGQTIGQKLISLGHDVFIGSREEQHPKGLDFVSKNEGKAQTGTFNQCAQFGEFLINCTSGGGTLDAISSIDSANLDSKILVDLANPLNMIPGQAPQLLYCNDISLGEMIQNKFPSVKVVKTLNTVWCGVMVNPSIIGNGDHTMFIAGNDVEAKAFVQKNILEAFGWLTENIMDLGIITSSRGMEMYLPLWLAMMGNTKTSAMNVKLLK